MLYPEGKGFFIWQVKRILGGDPTSIVNRAKELGLSFVVIKVLNGTAKYNLRLVGDIYVDDILPELIPALQNAGIDVYGYQYIYLNNGIDEALAAIARFQDLELDGLVIDAEGECYYKDVEAWKYSDLLRINLQNVPIGLCSFRFPSLHREIPWDAFLSCSTFHMPQVYWVEATNPAEQLERSYNELNEYKVLPFVPVGSSYDEFGWKPTISQLDEFNNKAQAMNFPGICWWEWYEAIQNDFEETIGNHSWKTEGDNTMSNFDLPDDTLFCIVTTDRCENGDWSPRQNCPEWEWDHGNTEINYPATKPYNETHKCNSKITTIRWPREWIQWYLDINEHNLKYACDIANGIVNNVNGQVQLEPPYDISKYPEMPKLEFLSFAGNIHAVDEVTETGVRVKSLHFSDGPQKGITWRNSIYFSKFTGIVPLGVGNPPNTDISKYTDLYDPADDCYHLVAVPDGKSAWLDKKEIEFFPPLGDVKIGSKDLIVRSGPGVEYPQVAVFYAEATVPINRYHPSGYDVWGRVSDNYWIPLRYQPFFGRQDYMEPTSWHLQSKPGLKPYSWSIDGEYDYVSPYADEYEPPEDEEMLYQVKVVCDLLNIRSGPWVTYPVVKTVTKDKVLNVYEVDDAYGWLRVSENTNEWCSGNAKYVEVIAPPPPPPPPEKTYQEGRDDMKAEVLLSLEDIPSFIENVLEAMEDMKVKIYDVIDLIKLMK